MQETHSSHCRSRVSLTRSLKHPKEYMLSNTSGSSSVRDKIRLTHTRLGGGCSGQGSLRPPLLETHTREGAHEHTATSKAATTRRIKHITMSRDWKWVCVSSKCLSTYRYQACFWMASSCKGWQSRWGHYFLQSVVDQMAKELCCANSSHPVYFYMHE